MAHSVRRLNEVAGFMMEPKIIVVPSFVHATRSQPNAVLLYDYEILCWQRAKSGNGSDDERDRLRRTAAET